MKETLKKSKGITLIALIITILILIILTVLVVKIVVDQKVFDNSRKTVDETNNKTNELQNTIDKLGEKLDDKKENDDNSNEEEIPKITLSYSTTQDTWTNDDITAEDKKWTNKNVTVTANFVNPAEDDLSEYTIQMSKDGTNWESGNTLTYEANGDVYARAMKDGSQVGDMIDGEVNIDKTLPNVGTVRVGTDFGDEYIYYEFDDKNYLEIDSDEYPGYQMVIEVTNGSDSESGHEKTTYSILEVDLNGREEDTLIENIETENVVKVDDGGGMNEPSSRLGSADNNHQYTIEVKTIDKVGNEATKTFTIVRYGTSI